MSKAIRIYTRFCDVLEKILFWVIAAIVSVMIVIVALQILGRYVLSQPWLWTIDMAILCLVWSTLLASACGVRRNAHFVIDLWPESWRGISRILHIFTVVIILVIGFYLLKEGWVYAEAGARRMAGMTGIKMSYFLASIPTGAALMLIFIVEQMLNMFHAQDKEASPS